MEVKGIKINIEGKSKEEIKKELKETFDKMIEEGLNETIENRDKLARLSIECKETKDREGFEVKTGVCGYYTQVVQMMADAILAVCDNMDINDPVEQAFFALQVIGMVTDHINDNLSDSEEEVECLE